MAQPFDMSCHCPPLGPVDAERGQFWIGNPWLFGASNRNLSCYERNRVYLNRGNGRFVDVSWGSGADDDGDGRGIAAGDLDGDGMPDLVVRQAGGGPLRVYRNAFPRRSHLTLRLRGRASNTRGIGARAVAEAGGRTLHREMSASNTFWAQGPAEIHFGLGDAARVDRLTIRWPSGAVQVLTDVAATRRVLVEEGRDELLEVPGGLRAERR